MRKRNETDAARGIPVELVREAMRDPAIRGRVFLVSKRRAPLLFEGQVVGFVSPHETKDGWRHGPIFVREGYRGRGLVEAYYKAHPERLCVAFVADDNVSSHRMHLRAGFVSWKRHGKGWFMRREPLASAQKTEVTHAA